MLHSNKTRPDGGGGAAWCFRINLKRAL